MSAWYGEARGLAGEAVRWVGGVAGEVVRAPWLAAVAMVAVGVVTLALGARLRRPIATLGGALVGVGAALAFSEAVASPLGLSPASAAGVAAAVLGAACFAFPPLFPAVAGALPGALAARGIAPADQQALALGLGAAVGAAVGAVLARLVVAAVASAIGAMVLALGVAGLLAHAGAGEMLLSHPVALVGLAAVLAVAGVAFQLPRAWPAGAAARRPAAEEPAVPDA
jgi:hypothetical protein